MKNFGYTKAFYTSNGQPSSRQRGQKGWAPLGPSAPRLSTRPQAHDTAGSSRLRVRTGDKSRQPPRFFTNVTVLRRHVLDGYDNPPFSAGFTAIPAEKWVGAKRRCGNETPLTPAPSTRIPTNLFSFTLTRWLCLDLAVLERQLWGAGHD